MPGPSSEGRALVLEVGVDPEPFVHLIGWQDPGR
jgi:hypothetical protein